MPASVNLSTRVWPPAGSARLMITKSGFLLTAWSACSTCFAMSSPASCMSRLIFTPSSSPMISAHFSMPWRTEEPYVSSNFHTRTVTLYSDFSSASAAGQARATSITSASARVRNFFMWFTSKIFLLTFPGKCPDESDRNILIPGRRMVKKNTNVRLHKNNLCNLYRLYKLQRN